MKRTCHKCRALEKDFGPNKEIPYGCLLGYEVRSVIRVGEEGLLFDPKPMEDCPKPTTWAAFGEAPLKGEHEDE